MTSGFGRDDLIDCHPSLVWYVTDHLVSTRALTDSAGNVVSTLDYDTYGNSVGNALTRFDYTGRERDAETGLLYYRARWYDPQTGRFLSEDPIGLSGGMNLFRYADGSPVGKADPTGLQCNCGVTTDCQKFVDQLLGYYARNTAARGLGYELLLLARAENYKVGKYMPSGFRKELVVRQLSSFTLLPIYRKMGQ